ncbi:MAG: DUF2993 domain-containing protein [Cyanobacteria bacterium Co-bin8]|nr:DUF2993 domain-containing protein [Cyanobacteria bacterium Co-bin8]
MTAGDSSLGDQAISKAVEMGLSTQLDDAEKLDVDVRTNPGSLMKGEVDSVEIEGKGMVMKGELRTEKLTVQTGNIAVNPLKAAFGQIELTRPTDASTVMLLKEDDIERAFNSEYIKNKLQNLEINVDGQPVRVNTQRVEFKLPGEGKVAIAADVTLAETGESKHLAFTAVPKMALSGQQVELQEVQPTTGGDVSALTNCLVESAQELLDLRNFEVPGMDLCLNRVDIRQGEMELKADARITEFPGG